MSYYRRTVRLRGGASVPCPVCDGPTRVVVTRRVAARVERRRRCLACGHEFRTRERVHVHRPEEEARP